MQFNRPIGDTQALAFYFNALTFLVTAFIVWRFIPVSGKPERQARTEVALSEVPGGAPGDDVLSGTQETVEAQRFAGFRSTLHEIRDGWKFICANPVVRAVNVGLAAGLLGGAMLVPLGPTFAKSSSATSTRSRSTSPPSASALRAGSRCSPGSSNGCRRTRVFVAALFFAGRRRSCSASRCRRSWLSAIGVFGLGLGAGAVYVLGFTLLQENTDDDLRGRTFTTFLTLVRLCVLGAMVLGPTVSALLNPVMESLVARSRRARGAGDPVPSASSTRCPGCG